jgi:signal transduction histidine kinase
LNQFLLHVRGSGQRGGPVDIAPVIGEAVALLQNSPDLQALHRVVFECTPGPVLCMADPAAIAQVFWNLARNGIEAMPEGGTLSIRLERQGRDAVLAVCDEGRGIGEEEVGRVFEPFHSRAPMGTGLGLAVVYRIVQEHSGDIGLRTTPGSGTEIEVRLPLIETRSDEEAAC